MDAIVNKKPQPEVLQIKKGKNVTRSMAPT